MKNFTLNLIKSAILLHGICELIGTPHHGIIQTERKIERRLCKMKQSKIGMIGCGMISEVYAKKYHGTVW